MCIYKHVYIYIYLPARADVCLLVCSCSLSCRIPWVVYCTCVAFLSFVFLVLWLAICVRCLVSLVFVFVVL